jgi:hypothetical protein
MAASPLSARRDATVVSVDGQVVVLGGSTVGACPPGADCAEPATPALRDGARYDPVTDSWRRIATAPVPLDQAQAVAVGRDVVVAVRAPTRPRWRLLAYSLRDDAWRRLPSPPLERSPWFTVAAGRPGEVVAYAASHEGRMSRDFVLRLGGASWRALPPDPLPRGFDRALVQVGRQRVLFEVPVAEVSGSRPPTYRAAVLPAGADRWQAVPPSQVLGNDPTWLAVGGRAVNASLGTADGGTVDPYPSALPFGGVLDPVSRTWHPLPDSPPDVPATSGASCGKPSMGDQQLVVSDAGEAWLPLLGRWTPVRGLPDGARTDCGCAVSQGSLVVWGGVHWSDQGLAATSTLLDSGYVWRPA